MLHVAHCCDIFINIILKRNLCLAFHVFHACVCMCRVSMFFKQKMRKISAFFEADADAVTVQCAVYV